MPIIVRLDVMLAKRKARSNELAEAVGITPSNLSLLKSGHVRGVRFFNPRGDLQGAGLPAGRATGVCAR